MAYAYRFQKVLEIKENEKEKSLADYNRSVSEFENAAEKLYSCLKKKEVLEDAAHTKLKGGMTVNEMRHMQQFVINLDKTIEHFQKLVMISRNRMNEKQHDLMEKNSEVKKYEKMKEKHFQAYTEDEKTAESRHMDELSIQVYLAKGN
ncbi:flagellar biosynthesis chaperone FliJ [Metabacillus sp. GX 13764]|uniref:flagellar export protein FliJ n=1 Tax=Metabacillus kandeliae TaxID=2900151 RepID=UPI001E4DEAFE|nr:flagellar export protein FliJ [Metabacillus kandeliae]MCD7033780.1 flagellar biosynthesis chaperone FliJ [Metabacillus kandeliae]